MFIQTEPTPNPATLKFLPGRTVLESGTAHFAAPAAAGNSPLAQMLFAIDGVTGVFLGSDFVTVTKDEDEEWYSLKPQILGVLMDAFARNVEILQQSAAAAAPEGEDDEIVVQIKELIESRVRPAVAQDGGDIVFEEFRDGVVFLQLHGSCAGCPSSTATLKMGIENMLKHYIPEVKEVRAVS
jgi:Fe-S cluster biogenesis protein NfuA